ncbi:hypothetical protein [Streptomyces sp. NPDC006739]|uniref:hypothetical protein n=1 Tax=Streptomyces sp. NPDC006739 TaxID=3364763 RepID=UPI0036CE13F3
MIIVAVLLLPVLGLMLYALDRVEDLLSGGPSAPRSSRRRHLRLVGGGDGGTERRPTGPPGRHVDAA